MPEVKRIADLSNKYKTSICQHELIDPATSSDNEKTRSERRQQRAPSRKRMTLVEEEHAATDQCKPKQRGDLEAHGRSADAYIGGRRDLRGFLRRHRQGQHRTAHELPEAALRQIKRARGVAAHGDDIQS